MGFDRQLEELQVHVAVAWAAVRAAATETHDQIKERLDQAHAIDARIYARQNEASRSIQHVSNLKKEAPDMGASDDLKKLAVRAKTAEDHAAAAKTQARAELQKTVTDVRDSAEAGAKKLQDQTRAAGQQASDSWNDVQQSWTAHFAKARQSMDHRKAKFDASNASSDADWAEWNAQLTIDYAYSAIEEAEYAVLDAILARRDAEEAAVEASR